MYENLDSIYATSDEEIKIILQSWGVQTHDPLTNKLNYTIMSYNMGNIDEDDHRYIHDQRFNSLYVASDERLIELSVAFNVNIRGKNRIDAIKIIIDKKLYPLSQPTRHNGYDLLTSTELIHMDQYGTSSLKIDDQKLTPYDVLSVNCGARFTTVLTKKGLYGMGDNFGMQLGYHKFNIANVPYLKPIQTPSQVKWVTCGFDFTMMMIGNDLYALGNNINSKLGTIDRSSNIYIPTRVQINNVLYVSCGADHSVAITTDGTYSWGHKNGKYKSLGRETNKFISPEDTPKKIPLEGVISIACGDNHTIALTGDSLYGWGYGYSTEDQIIKKLPYKGVLWFTCGQNRTVIMTTEGIYIWESKNRFSISEPARIMLGGTLWASCNMYSDILIMTTHGLYKATDKHGSFVLDSNRIQIEGVTESLFSSPKDILAEGLYRFSRRDAVLSSDDPLAVELAGLPWNLNKEILSRRT